MRTRYFSSSCRTANCPLVTTPKSTCFTNVHLMPLTPSSSLLQAWRRPPCVVYIFLSSCYPKLYIAIPRLSDPPPISCPFWCTLLLVSLPTDNPPKYGCLTAIAQTIQVASLRRSSRSLRVAQYWRWIHSVKSIRSAVAKTARSLGSQLYTFKLNIVQPTSSPSSSFRTCCPHT